ncbi:MAG TPA: glycosyltransferase family 25 protein [Chlamydiales bacterium]|nr:glycosyltransferase family 25 protein [Chlamydiales bacterium]
MIRYLIKLFFLSWLFVFSVDGSVSKHLKPALGKGEGHQMPGIDFIYMINLDQRPEKFARSLEELLPFGIVPYRFSAVNGWELTVEAINEVGLKFRPGMTALMATSFPPGGRDLRSHAFMSQYGKAYFCHGMARGTIGCALSHISVLKDAWESGYETIWVMEDDIEVLEDPTLIPDLINRLDQLVGRENWDVLFTDQDIRTGPGEYVRASGAAKRPDMDCSLAERTSEKYTIDCQISPDFRKIGARFGAHSMIIRRSGIKKLLDFALEHEIFLPYDMDNYLMPNISRYSLTSDVVSNMPHTLSDNGTPGYEGE